jgi:predicted ATP-dependent serine protease
MPRAPKVKMTYVMEKENVDQVRALAKRLGVTQSEIIECLVELSKDSIRDDIINKLADKLEQRAKRLRRMATPK